MEYLPLHAADKQTIEQTAKEFCQQVIRKNHDAFIKAKQFPREVFKKMGEIGFLGAMIPEKYGGAGMSMSEYVVLMESLACYGGGSIALTLIAHHSLAAMHILYAGTEEQKQFYLPKMATSELIGAWCLTEPGAGSDAFGKGMKTVATLLDTGWVISGPKLFITNGSIADVYVVLAKIPSEDGCGAFIVPRPFVALRNLNSIQCRKEENKMGMHASDTSAVTFDSAYIGPDSRMRGDGKKITYQVLNNGRIAISALACGLMRSALSEARTYAKERETFGRTIAEYQGISFPLADASAELTASWAMVEKAALAVDKGELTPKISSETKLKTTRSAYEACLSAIFTFGGLGYVMDSRVTQDFTDALLLRIGEGTDNMQRLGVVKGLFPKNEVN